jgi:hypothetical protein
MSLVQRCSAPECGILTMGALCLDHEREAKGLGEAALVAALTGNASEDRHSEHQGAEVARSVST